jgi:hypothetical protein
MTQQQAMQLADRALEQILRHALVSYLERMVARGAGPQEMKDEGEEYGRALVAWKAESLVNIEQDLFGPSRAIH